MFSILILTLAVIGNLYLAHKKDRSLLGWGFLGIILPVLSMAVLLFLRKKTGQNQKIPIKRSGAQTFAFVGINILRIFSAAVFPLIIAFQISDAVLRKKVDVGAIPPSFPIAVVTPIDRAQGFQVNIIEQRELNDFLGKTPEYSYLIPDQEGSPALSQVPNEPRYWFRVEKKEGDRQSLVVSSSPYDADSRNIGWYDAADKEIFPRYHLRYFEPAVFVGPGGIAILFSMYLIWQLFGFLLRKLKLE